MSAHSNRSRLVLGTRGSALAWTQSNLVKTWLEAKAPGLVVEMKVIKTEGDRLQEAPPAPGERLAKGLFTSALERALLASEIDLAVHSLKDLPTVLEPGLVVAAIPSREDPRDAIVSAGPSLAMLPRGARVLTGSPRRRLQLLLARPDLVIEPVRGNVDTRIAKVRGGECAAVVLALAGLRRLGRANEANDVLEPKVVLPAPGQGALAIETRDDDVAPFIASLLDHAETRACVLAERAVLAGVGGGCQLPLGAFARFDGDRLALEAILFSEDGARVARAEARGEPVAAAAIGAAVANQLVHRLRGATA